MSTKKAKKSETPKKPKQAKKTDKPKKAKKAKEPVVVKANAPIVVVAEDKPAEEKPVKPKKVKPNKAMKTTQSFSLGSLPDSPAYAPSKVADGWRNYRLWAQAVVEWDDKDTEEEILKTIKKHITTGKKDLMEALEAFDAEQLVVKTVLKKDAYPYEPFIEAIVAIDAEDDVRSKLLALPTITVIDPDLTYAPAAFKVEPEEQTDD